MRKTMLGKFVLCGLAAATLASLSSSAAYAFGGCGRNGHRNAWGACVYGGQNQGYCAAVGGTRVRMPNGNVRCVR
ncbi:GCG_CRPN prefix-to-repeats domain-containing protein [Methylocystis parvus]|uniref:GCG_CRPN prefix-to-repeats domain-containing protein n=1 Tax=Methylocystis parvus TaxID=134 RepID=UPI003C73B977